MGDLSLFDALSYTGLYRILTQTIKINKRGKALLLPLYGTPGVIMYVLGELRFLSMIEHALRFFRKIEIKVVKQIVIETSKVKVPNNFVIDYISGHPKVVGFVTHGGMLSLSETTYCGKPVLVIPFFGDQFSNAAAAVANGMGIILNFDKLNADNLAEGMQELTTEK